MIFGMTTATFTLIHVALSLVGIGAGFVVFFGLISAKPLDGWTALFLVTTVLTSVTGFGFPFERLLPSHIVGIISLVALAAAIVAWYVLHLNGVWRKVYVISAALTLYLTVFVTVVQSFQKVPALRSLAPTQSEPPFLVAQIIVMVLVAVLATVATKRSRAIGIPVA